MNVNIAWHKYSITSTEREIANNQKAAVIWLTGLSGSGKSTIANALDKELWERGQRSYVLDGDNLRHGLCSNLGFLDEDRTENIRRAGEVAKLFVDSGLFAVVSLISPYETDRKKIKELIGAEKFIDVFVDAPLTLCEERDPKGLYLKVRDGQIKNFTGVDSVYEVPQSPKIYLNTELDSVDVCVEKIITFLIANSYIWSNL